MLIASRDTIITVKGLQYKGEHDGHLSRDLLVLPMQYPVHIVKYQVLQTTHRQARIIRLGRLNHHVVENGRRKFDVSREYGSCGKEQKLLISKRYQCSIGLSTKQSTSQFIRFNLKILMPENLSLVLSCSKTAALVFSLCSLTPRCHF